MDIAYLDNTAGTPLHPDVLAEMLPYLEEHFGNPSSLHGWGDAPRDALETARGRVAGLIGCSPEEVIFTSNGSEANNLALKGLAMANQKRGKHIVVSAIEHFSVLHSGKSLGKLGFEVTEVPVDSSGLVLPDDVAKSVREDTVLVSVMHANTEVGTVEPVAEIAKAVKAKDEAVIVHTDAVGAAGTIPVDVRELGVDALSLAGNMFYGPKGSGALFLSRGVRLQPQLDGGIQEGGRRAGTENVPGIVGLGKAAELAKAEMAERTSHLRPLRDRLLDSLPAAIFHTTVTGSREARLPGHASFCVRFIEGESMLMFLADEGIAVSSGSACTSRALKASHVLIAMGISHEIAQGSVVFGLGRDNADEDITHVLEAMPPVVERLRSMSPLYTQFINEQNR